MQRQTRSKGKPGSLLRTAQKINDGVGEDSPNARLQERSCANVWRSGERREAACVPVSAGLPAGHPALRWDRRLLGGAWGLGLRLVMVWGPACSWCRLLCHPHFKRAGWGRLWVLRGWGCPGPAGRGWDARSSLHRRRARQSRSIPSR